MSDVFVSYARSTAKKAQQVAEALRGLGYSVWIDDDLPAHRTYGRVIEEQMTVAKAAVVIWSADAVQSEWVLSEANRAREHHKLVQVATDAARLPMPFDTIQCADMTGWTGDIDAPGWRKVTASVADLVGREAAALARPIEQAIRFCKAADGVRIAYAQVGEGPALLKTANWLNHLEFDWGGPVWGALYHRMSVSHTLIRYDERGNGLSDWDAEELSLAAYVADMEAVVDAAGLERFPIFAISQGGSVAIEYAARHPERVSRLILMNAFARGWRWSSSPALIANVEAMKVLMAHGWGGESSAFRQMFATLMLPGATSQQWDAFDAMQRATTSPENAVRLIESFGRMDVRHRLAEVRAPTLVLHSRDDRFVPARLGQEIAAGIAGARFVGLATNNHILLADEPAFEKVASEVQAFLAQDT
jgi:pimeloyl-ACP methyl ester carboxylesterase